jgi:hypothetical protein
MMFQLWSQFAAACSGGSFLGLPTWYKYLQSKDASGQCVTQFTRIADLWLVVAAIIEIMLRVAALLAIGLLVWAGIKYIYSRGEPDKVKDAQDTAVNSVVGLIIAVSATALITFIAGRF